MDQVVPAPVPERRHLSALRPMTVADLDEVMVVQRDGAQAGLAHIFAQDQFPFPVDAVRRRWEHEIADPGIDCFVILNERHVIAGFSALRANELLHFGTALSSWGSGLAGRAHDEALLRWASQGHQHALLRVFEANVRARRFYERRGWVDTGDRSTSDFAPYPVLLTYETSLDGKPRPSPAERAPRAAG